VLDRDGLLMRCRWGAWLLLGCRFSAAGVPATFLAAAGVPAAFCCLLGCAWRSTSGGAQGVPIRLGSTADSW